MSSIGFVDRGYRCLQTWFPLDLKGPLSTQSGDNHNFYQWLKNVLTLPFLRVSKPPVNCLLQLPGCGKWTGKHGSCTHFWFLNSQIWFTLRHIIFVNFIIWEFPNVYVCSGHSSSLSLGFSCSYPPLLLATSPFSRPRSFVVLWSILFAQGHLCDSWNGTIYWSLVGSSLVYNWRNDFPTS